MEKVTNGTCLTAVLVDYDNIYLSLKRRNEEAATRFAKNTRLWLSAIESGQIITPTNGSEQFLERRIVLSRCYGNPVPRKNERDNTTDMSSFPFVRHNFLRSGFEIIDCPPLTAQLKNSSDIRMVMDLRDFLDHNTYFDEFIILSGDADFTPVLHRLRAHARRTVIYANDHTAVPYTAICDGEIREMDLMNVLMAGDVPKLSSSAPEKLLTSNSHNLVQDARSEIIGEIVNVMRSSDKPVPIAYLADHVQKTLGAEKTLGTNWGGTGAFRTLLKESLPEDIALNDTPPHYAYDPSRHVLPQNQGQPALEAPSSTPINTSPLHAQISQGLEVAAQTVAQNESQALQAKQALQGNNAPFSAVQSASLGAGFPMAGGTAGAEPISSHALNGPEAGQAPGASNLPDPMANTQFEQGPLGQTPGSQISGHQVPAAQNPSAQVPAPQSQNAPTDLQGMIARIHEASQVPPLSPPDYRAMFEAIALELNENGLNGGQTLTNIATRAAQGGVEIARGDIQFIVDVISEADPWFEQGASANLFSGRFRNYVVARCRKANMQLSSEELDLIDAWFVGPVAARDMGQENDAHASGPTGGNAPTEQYDQGQSYAEEAQQQAMQVADNGAYNTGGQPNEFPRIVRAQGRA